MPFITQILLPKRDNLGRQFQRKRLAAFHARMQDDSCSFPKRQEIAMSHGPPSALITDQGQRVLLRICGRYHDLSQQELRTLLGIPSGPPGLGITIERDRLRFEFAVDEQIVVLTADQLQRRLAKRSTTKA